jgi:tellurite resistance protein
MAYLTFTVVVSARACHGLTHGMRLWTTGHRLKAVTRIPKALTDPSAAAARGKWLARGAWLLAAAEVVMAVRNHVTDRLTPRERNRIVEIVRSSKGRPSNLSNRERNELQTLLAKVEPADLAKKVVASPFAGRLRRRR